MAEVDVKFSAITPSTQNADANTKLVSVQGGANDLLFTMQQLSAGPYLSNASSLVAAPVGLPRPNTTRASEILNVRDFGAVGDGVTNDTAAIQQAFSYSQANTNGTTAIGNATLHFSPTNLPAWLIPGMICQNLTTASLASLASNTVVTAVNATTGAVTISPAAFSPGVGSGDTIQFGPAGRVYFPPGKYVVTAASSGGPAIRLPGKNVNQKIDPSIIIEGAGNATQIIASPGFNGFIFDDMDPTSQRATSQPWVMRDMTILNPYKPTNIYNNTAVAAAAWVTGDPSIVVTAASTPGIQPGAIIFDTVNTPSVPCYIGYVTAVALNTPAPNQTTLTIGDAVVGGVTGAQFGSFGSADTLYIVQGFFAASAFTAGPFSGSTSITMATANPGLAAGNYYVWDWSIMTSGTKPYPGAVWVTTSANWSGTTLTGAQTGGQTSVSSAGRTNDLLVFSPISGAVRVVSAQTSSLQNLRVSGVIGFSFDCSGIPTADVNSTGLFPFEVSVKNCNVTSSLANSCGVGGHGIFTGQSTIIENCDFGGNWVGARFNGINPQMTGGRVEVCAFALVLGGAVKTVGANAGCSQPVIGNTEFEGSWVASLCTDTSGLSGGLIYNIGGGNSHVNSCYGVYLGGGVSGGTVFLNCSFGSVTLAASGSIATGGYWNPSFKGPGTPSGVYLPSTSNASGPNCTFISCVALAIPGANNVTLAAQGFGQLGGVAWHMPITGGFKFIGCNNPPYILTFSQLPVVDTVTGSITNGFGGTGKIINISGGSLGASGDSVGVGSRILGGAGVTVLPNTQITGTTLQVGSSANKFVVNNSQNVPAGSTLLCHQALDGDEYYISDSPIPYSPLFVASGSGTASVTTSITLTVNVPAYITGDMTVYNDTTNQIIGQVRNPTVGPPYSGATINLNGAALSGWSNTDGIIFYPLSNVGAPVRVGGSTNHVKVRWNAVQQNWVIV